jgi:hypothetical protein
MKSINDSLKVIASNKDAIKVASAENKALFKELFIIINEEIKSIKSNSMFKDTKKSALVLIAKANLKVDVKDFGLFTLVCNYISLGLSLDLQNEDITVNTIKRVIYYINKGWLSKTKANKSEDIKALVSELNKQLKEAK